jgi:hypothetical protein
MKLYSKTIIGSENTIVPLPIHNKNYANLNSCEFKEDDIFHYDRHDLSLRSMNFDDFIDQITAFLTIATMGFTYSVHSIHI